MGTLYRQIASDIASDIEQGLYMAGQKVPSVRKLSQSKAVSISTINQAYALLEDQGYITARPQSGYYVREGANDPISPPPISQGSEPQLVTKSDLIAHMLHGVHKETVLDLGTAIAHEDYLPLKSLQNHVNKVTRFHTADVFNYMFSPGYEPLRRQIATRMRGVSVKCHQEDIVITQGCSEALASCLKVATKPGDIVAVESPCYYGFLQLAKQFGLKVIEIPTDAQLGISLDALMLALKQWPIKLIAVSSRFSNPTGSAMSAEKQKKLYQLAQGYDCFILEDDIYGELGFENALNTVLKTYDTDERVLYCSSFSKSLSPGLRIGWCLPGRFKEEMILNQTFSSFSPSTISQYAVSSYLSTGHYDKHLRKLRQICADNMKEMTTLIRQYFPRDTQLTQPNGCFILWIKLPHGVDGKDFHKQALKLDINVAPGSIFSNTEEFNHFIRINCGLPINKTIKNAIQSLGDLARLLQGQN